MWGCSKGNQVSKGDELDGHSLKLTISSKKISGEGTTAKRKASSSAGAGAATTRLPLRILPLRRLVKFKELPRIFRQLKSVKYPHESLTGRTANSVRRVLTKDEAAAMKLLPKHIVWPSLGVGVCHFRRCGSFKDEEEKKMRHCCVIKAVHLAIWYIYESIYLLMQVLCTCNATSVFLAGDVHPKD